MFACIHGRTVSGSSQPATENIAGGSELVDLAFTFSPLIEQTTQDTVVLDVSGQDLLFGSPVNSFSADKDVTEIESARTLANEIVQRASALNLRVDVAVASNPDVAIHLARSCNGITVINSGEELSKLSALSIKRLDFSLAGIEADRVEEFQETFSLWGIRTFGDLARLPLGGVAERLGQAGVLVQKLAQGRTDRRLNLVRPPLGFKQSIELEHAVVELEPLTFILSRLLNQLCANLYEYALATNELRLQVVTEPGAIATGSDGQSNVNGQYQRTITLPVPMRNPRTLLRLLLFDVEAQPPPAPIVAITIIAEPVEPRAAQTGFFIPLTPEPEKLEITLARLAKLVGSDKVGSPELLDTHRPDAFRMKRFRISTPNKRARSNQQIAVRKPQSVMTLRIFRPSWRAEVKTMQGQPSRISAFAVNSAARVRGHVVRASGPWRMSGEWWRAGVWARDEWDVALIDSTQTEVLCRIYRDMTSDEWFVAGIYD